MKEGSRMRLRYNDAGTLKGDVPNGDSVVVRHLKSGPSGFEVLWDGEWHRWLRSEWVEEELGIGVHRKKTGSQAGFPSEAVTRAIWRHFVDRWNYGDSEVEYSF